MGNYATALTGSPQRPRKPPQRRPLAAASSPLATASTPSTDFTMRQHLQLLQPLQSCNSAIGAIDAIRNTKQLAVMCPTPPRPDLLAVIVSTEPPRCHCRTSPPTCWPQPQLRQDATENKLLNIWLNEIFCLTLPPRKPEKRH